MFVIPLNLYFLWNVKLYSVHFELYCACALKKRKGKGSGKKTIELAMKRGTNLKILKWYVVSNHFGQGRHNANDNQ